jgi:phospholipid N-methyltransferase
MIFHFIRQSIRNPVTIGAVLPSGARLARAMAVAALPDGRPPTRILEVGPGTGPITAQLSRRLTPTDQLNVVELNEEFCKLLREKYPQIPVHQQSILDYEPAEKVHCIVSGLPLANFPADVVEAIYKHFFKLLEPGGRLIMFQYIGLRHAVRAVAGRADRERMDRILSLENRMEPLVTGRVRVSLNIPPAVVTIRRRPDDLQLLG